MLKASLIACLMALSVVAHPAHSHEGRSVKKSSGPSGTSQPIGPQAPSCQPGANCNQKTPEKNGTKPQSMTIAWNQDYMDSVGATADSVAQFTERWRFVCEKVVAPIHQHHWMTVKKGPKPCTAIVQCSGLQTNGQDDNAVIPGGYWYDHTDNTFATGNNWGWWATSYSNNVCKISAAQWAKM